MNKKNLFGLPRLIVLVLLLLAITIAPAAAQEPETEGDVEAQVSFHGGFSLNPFSDLLGVTTAGVNSVRQIVPRGGSATTEFVVLDVEDLYSVNLAFDYDGDVVRVANVRPGSLFDELTPGVDFIMSDINDSTCFAGAPLDPPSEFTLPVFPNPPDAPEGFPAATNPSRCYVSIAVTNLSLPPVRGNGSLIRIDWDVQDVAVGRVSEVDFTLASLLDEFGNRLEPCVAPAPPCSNLRPDPSEFNDPVDDDPFQPPINFVIGLLEVGPAAVSLNFQVALEGGKAPHEDLLAVPVPRPGVDVVVTDLPGCTVNPVAPTPTSSVGNVDTSGCGALPYDSVEIRRDGYLRYIATDVSSINPALITLLAGDVNGDDSINILDLMSVASNFNLPATPVNERMNYVDDNRITIADLVFVAKNFGVVGPSPITPGPSPSPGPRG